jgi:hypothetical protein
MTVLLLYLSSITLTIVYETYDKGRMSMPNELAMSHLGLFIYDHSDVFALLMHPFKDLDQNYGLTHVQCK